MRDAIPGFTRRPGELIIGTVAPLRPEKNIGRLLRVFAMLDTSLPVRLVVAGDGAERGALERFAQQLGISDRVSFTGRVLPGSVLGSFDIFALSSDTEQMPNAADEKRGAKSERQVQQHVVEHVAARSTHPGQHLERLGECRPGTANRNGYRET